MVFNVCSIPAPGAKDKLKAKEYEHRKQRFARVGCKLRPPNDRREQRNIKHISTWKQLLLKNVK